MSEDSYSQPYRVPFDQSFDIKPLPTQQPKSCENKKTLKKMLKVNIAQLDELQQVMYAHNYHSALFVFQAIDAGGKDSTIRAVFKGINPAGCKVFSFKQPSSKELEHDFLWRCHNVTPERGCFAVFNRSYYEETLAVRVHPEYLENQRIPHKKQTGDIWAQRYESINAFEKHLSDNGTLIIKFWLNLSKKEQKQRFLSRLNEPEKHWKFSEADLKERALWPKYTKAFEDTLKNTSKPWAPWYAIPADYKPYARWLVSEIIVEHLKKLDMQYPTVSEKDKARFEKYRKALA